MLATTLKPISGSHKRKEVKAVVKNLAMKIGPGGKLPTVKELCESLHVAKATVDVAMDSLQSEGAIYRKHGSGVYVSPHIHRRLIGLVYGFDIFQTGASPFSHMLTQQAQARSASKNERFSFYLDVASGKEGVPTHHDLMDDVQSGRLSGVIFAGVQNLRSLEWVLQQRVPVAALASNPLAPYRVIIDFAEVVRLGVQALLEAGCRSITLIPPLSEDWESLNSEAVNAFREAMRRAGLEQKPEAIWSPFGSSQVRTRPVAGTFEELGDQAIKEIFGERTSQASDAVEWPDGLVIADDIMTRGAMVALHQLGLRTGEDLKIATHANRGSPALRAYEQELIRFEVDPAEVVEALFGMLETLMEGKTPPEAVVLIRPHRVGIAEDKNSNL